jgi:AraC-like DNA-binding protein
MKRILGRRGKLSITSLEREILLSQRRLEQLFRQHTGMSLKNYADIARFQSVLATAEEHTNLTTLGLETGYYDQSHFIRHFRKFTGTSPSAFLKKEEKTTGKISNLYNFAS